MWQRFTESARKVVYYAQEEARTAGTSLVTPSHLLFGLVRDDDNIAVRILSRLGVGPETVRAQGQAQEQVWPPVPRSPAPPSVGDMQLTSAAKSVIDAAYKEATALRNNWIGTEHLLLGLTRNKGPAREALARLGVGVEQARAEVVRLQGEAPLPAPKASFWSRLFRGERSAEEKKEKM